MTEVCLLLIYWKLRSLSNFDRCICYHCQLFCFTCLTRHVLQEKKIQCLLPRHNTVQCPPLYLKCFYPFSALFLSFSLSSEILEERRRSFSLFFPPWSMCMPAREGEKEEERERSVSSVQGSFTTVLYRRNPKKTLTKQLI